jgi:hypothetical protein
LKNSLISSVLVALAVFLSACGTPDIEENQQQHEELSKLIEQWQAEKGDHSQSQKEPNSQYCQTLTHWRNNPQDFQGSSELFGLMLDMGCTHCWDCRAY